MTSDKVFDDCHFIKYNEPIKIEKKFPLLVGNLRNSISLNFKKMILYTTIFYFGF